ncbi:MAG: hypothetical protein MUO60_18845 [Clostridiaceae bacterium]|nr:hypothetical protein [Clostridiaceae bacterium]
MKLKKINPITSAKEFCVKLDVLVINEIELSNIESPVSFPINSINPMILKKDTFIYIVSILGVILEDDSI